MRARVLGKYVVAVAALCCSNIRSRLHPGKTFRGVTTSRPGLKMKIYDHEEIRGWRERKAHIRLSPGRGGCADEETVS